MFSIVVLSFAVVDMSIEDLENFVSVLVRGSNCDAHDHGMNKPKWWPDQVKFCYPVLNSNINNIEIWKKTLLLLVLRCFHSQQINKNCGDILSEKRKRHSRELNETWQPNNGRIKSQKNLEEHVFSSSSPIVAVEDICNTNCNLQLKGEAEKIKREYFFGYLNLKDKSRKKTYNTYFGQNQISAIIPNNVPLTPKLGLTFLQKRKKIKKTKKNYLRKRPNYLNKLCQNYKSPKKNKKKLCDIRYLHNNKIDSSLQFNNTISKNKEKMKECKPCFVRLQNIDHFNSIKLTKEETNGNINNRENYLQRNPIVLLERIPCKNMCPQIVL